MFKLPINCILPLLLVPISAQADEGRYQLEKSGDSYVRLDTQSGEMSICEKHGSQLVCRVAAEERAAFQDEIDRLDGTVVDLEKRISVVEKQLRNSREKLPSEEEFERSLGYMERFMRRFMDIIEDFDRPSDDGDREVPDRT